MSRHSKPVIGISRCLLGENVRYDGGNTFQENLKEMIGDTFELFGVCPEVEMGLGIPRETIQLVKIEEQVHLMNSARNRDLTNLAQETFKKFNLGICDGFILQSRSPSCGFKTTKLYQRDSQGEENLISEESSGVFTNFLQESFTEIPLLDSSELQAKVDDFLLKVKNHHKKRP